MLRRSQPLLLLCSSLWSRSFAEATSNFSGQDVSSKLSSPATASADSLSNYCQSVYSHFTHTYSSTILATSLHPWYEGYGPTDSNGVLTGPVTSQSYYTDTIIYTQYAGRAYTAVPPCCADCYMTAGTINFYMWSDQASATSPPSGSPSTIVNADGFTFTSPSVYMAFSSLKASNMCGQVGDIWTSTTIGFDPTEITTANPITTVSVISTPYVEEGRTYEMILSVITTQPPPQQIRYTDIGQDCATLPGYTYWAGNPINADNANYVHDPCHPIILLPSRLISMNPAWASASCSAAPGTTGAYDPPRILTPAASVAAATLPGGDKPTPPATRAAAGDSASETAAPRTSPIAYYDNISPSLVTTTASGTVYVKTVAVLAPSSESADPKGPLPARPAFDSQSASADEAASSQADISSESSSAGPASAIASAMGLSKSSSSSSSSSDSDSGVTGDAQSSTTAFESSSGTSAKTISSTSSSLASSSLSGGGDGVTGTRTLGLLVLGGVFGLVLL